MWHRYHLRLESQSVSQRVVVGEKMAGEWCAALEPVCMGESCRLRWPRWADVILEKEGGHVIKKQYTVGEA